MAPPPENHRSFLRRISIHRNQVVSMDVNHEQKLEGFQKHVSEHFSELISPPPSPYSPSSSSSNAASQSSDPILSIPWLQNLLDVFMSCETEFKKVLTTTQISKSSSLDKVLTEMLDRILKTLDLCNAVVTGIDSVRKSQRLAEITVAALKKRPLCNGSVRRAKRALKSLLVRSSHKTTSRSWSFGQRVQKDWSATKQIQAMMSNLAPPRGGEASGLGMPIYIMSNLMVLVMWVLVAAVPCQTSSVLLTPLALPKHQSWASAAVNIQERVSEVLKHKDKRCGGVMEEMQRMERIGSSLMEFTEGFKFPAKEEEEEEVAEKVEEMEKICRRMEFELEDLQMQVKEVFHRLAKLRMEIVSVLNQSPAI